MDWKNFRTMCAQVMNELKIYEYLPKVELIAGVVFERSSISSVDDATFTDGESSFSLR